MHATLYSIQRDLGIDGLFLHIFGTVDKHLALPPALCRVSSAFTLEKVFNHPFNPFFSLIFLSFFLDFFRFSPYLGLGRKYYRSPELGKPDHCC